MSKVGPHSSNFNATAVTVWPGKICHLPLWLLFLSVSVVLGGRVFEIRTDGYLVTSIIHPSHELAGGYGKAQITTSSGESRMPDYSDVMTALQLTDLVAFLQSQYTVVPPPLPFP